MKPKHRLRHASLVVGIGVLLVLTACGEEPPAILGSASFATNVAPVAVADAATVLEGGSVLIDVLANDTDADGAPTYATHTVTVPVAGQPAQGTATPGPAGVTYVHLGSETLADSFTVQVCDASAACSSAAVSITVTAVNDAPTFTATPPTTTTNEDTPTSALAVTVADIDSTVATLVLTGTSSDTVLLPNSNIVSGGTGANRTITLTPATNRNGSSTVTLNVSDGTDSANTTFVLTVAAVNDAPVAAADAATVAEGGTVVIPVLTNDSDVDNTLAYPGSVTLGAATNGSVSVGTTGVSFTHDGGETATGTFQYQATDGSLSSTAVTATITVTAVNDNPTITGLAATASTNEDVTSSALTFTVGDAETPAASLTLSAASSNTTLVPVANVAFGGSGANRTVTISPAANQSGSAAITVTVSDTATIPATATASVTLTVTAQNDAPVAVADSGAVLEGGTSVIDVLLNDNDVDNSLAYPGSVTLIGTPLNGTAAVTGSGVSFTHDGSETTSGSFQYGVTDGVVNSATVTATITVTPVNDPPSITAIGTQTTTEDTATGTLVVTLSDPDSPPGNVTLTGSSGNTAVLSQAGFSISVGGPTRNLILTPVANASGSATVTLTATDSASAAGTTTFTFTVTSVNDAPSAVADSATVAEGGSVVVDVLTNDSDIDSTLVYPAAVTLISTPVNGSVVVGSSGVTYTHNGSETTTGSFQYQVTDGALASSTVTVSVTVTPANDPPTVTPPATQTLTEDTASGAITATVGDVDTLLSSVTLIGTSSDTTVITNAGIAISGTGASRTLVLTPAPNGTGTTTITLTASDGSATGTATFTLNVTNVNDPPTLQAVSAQSTNEDVVKTVSVTVSDPDTSLNSLTLTGTSNNTTVLPNSGIVASATGSPRTLTLTPAANASGSTTVTLTLSDGAFSVTQTFVLTVTAVNDAPVAVDDSSSVTEGGAATVAVLANDSDVDNSLVYTPMVSIVGTPVNGGAVVQSYGVVFTHNGSETTTASFQYRVNDGALDSNTATVSLVVGAGNDAPTMSPVSAQAVTEDGSVGPIAVTVFDNDTDAALLTLTGSSSAPLILPNSGIVPGGTGQNRTLTLTPAANATGTATVTLTLTDGVGGTAQQAFVLTVTAVNDAPVAVADTATVGEGSTQSLSVLANDTDVDTDLLANGTITIVSPPSVGSATISGPDVIYAHNGSETTSDLFTYKVKDGFLDSGIVNVTITITPQNDAPTLGAVANQTVPEDGSVGPVAFTVSDSDHAASTITLSASSSDPSIIPSGGVTFGGSGGNRTVTFTPLADQNGSATITITATDPAGGAASLTPLVIVNAVNDAPVAVADSFTVAEGSTTTLAVQGNDVDIDNILATEVSVQIVSPPSHGSASVLGPAVSYVHGGDEVTTDSFSYQLHDGALSSGVATVTITITAINDPPTVQAIADQSTTEDTPILGLPFTIGDAESPASALSVLVTSGTASVVANSGITVLGTGTDRTMDISPVEDGSGSSTLTVTVTDPQGGATIRSFLVTVGAANDAPVAQDDSRTVAENGSTDLDILANDDDPDTLLDYGHVVIDLLPLHGQLTVETSLVHYVHDGGEDGSDSFSYHLNDGNLDSNTAVVSFTVTPVNDAPTAIADSTTAPEGGAVLIDVLGNDSDAESTLAYPASVVVSPGAVGGTVAVTPTGITFNHDGGETDGSFQYRVTDGVALSELVTVTVVRVPENDVPVAGNDQQTVAEGGSVEIDLLLNDSDEDDVLVLSNVEILVPPTVGTASPGGTGILYVHDGGESITDSFSYRVGDGTAFSLPATVAVSITPVNDPPLAVADTGTVAEGGSVEIPVLDNDNDPETVLSYSANVTIVGTATGGVPLVTATGVTFSHDGSEQDGSFRYELNDGELSSAPVTVLVTRTPVNDPPVITRAMGTGSVSIQDLVNGATEAVPFTVTDADDSAAALVVTAEADDVAILPPGNLVVSTTSDGERLLGITTHGTEGTTTVTVTVSDPQGLVGTTTLVVTVACASGTNFVWTGGPFVSDPECDWWDVDDDNDGSDDIVDCNDINPLINPAATETCENTADQDCDGLLDYVDEDTDTDGDGYSPCDPACNTGDTGPCGAVCVNNTSTCWRDCDDGDDSRRPGVPEVCEGGTQEDTDCNGDVNTQDVDNTDSLLDNLPDAGEGSIEPDASTALLVYLDQDFDGFGGGTPEHRCEEPTPCVDGTPCYVYASGDCAVNNAQRFPGAPEICNGLDEDCDNVVDEPDDLNPVGSGCLDMYRDLDQDGVGDSDVTARACLCNLDQEPFVTYESERYVSFSGDCDDLDALTHPAAGEASDTPIDAMPEIYDGNDNDCDGFLALVELDCDDDGALADFPGALVLGDPLEAGTLDAEPCTGEDWGADEERSFWTCWGMTLPTPVCRPESTGDPTPQLWELRLSESEDGFGARFVGGRREYTAAPPCGTWPTPDCDDQCAQRCADLVEVCDGIDNDCAGAPDTETTTLLGAMRLEDQAGGYVSDREIDLDGDGYLHCDDFEISISTQSQLSSRSCVMAVSDPVFQTDCNSRCVLANPAAVERCDGTLDLCGGAAEGLDEDHDSHRTCGAWSLGGAGDPDAMPEDVYVAVWVEDLDKGDSGDDDSAEGPHLAMVPLLLPRVRAAGKDGPEGPIECDVALAEGLAGLLPGNDGEERVVAAATAGSMTALLPDLCGDAAQDRTDGHCAVIRVTLDSNADDTLSQGDSRPWESWPESFLGSCTDHPEQIASRTVWSASRIRESRETAAEAECLRMYGRACAEVEVGTELMAKWDRWPVAEGGLDDPRWWKEIIRFAPHAMETGTILSCWSGTGDNAGRAAPAVGGDCGDSINSANRDNAEGPWDVVALLAWDTDSDVLELPSCEACIDGIDNNCDGRIDCEDPSCAVCFVSQGSGCGAEGSPCKGPGCKGSFGGEDVGTGRALTGSLILFGVAMLKRRRRTHAAA